MKAVKPLSLGLLTRPFRFQGRQRLCIAAVGFFRLGADSHRFLGEAEQWPNILAALPPATALDEIYPKPQGEFLLSGNAYTPQGEAMPQLQVDACVGPLRKTLHIQGDRRWYYGPWYKTTPAATFTDMPLDFAHAYGGPKLADNPLGKGHTGNPVAGWIGQNEGDMPNLEYPDQPIHGHVLKQAIANYAPIDPSWPARRRLAGTYDKQWLLEEAPGLARDLDPQFFLRTAPDQWLPGHWQGGEPYRLQNLHPDHPLIEGTLPAFKARGFARYKATGQVVEAPMALDTVWLLPNTLLGVLLYHGTVEVEDVDALDIDAVLVGYEAADAPRPQAHYHEVLRLRSDVSTAAMHILNEDQLAPSLPDQIKAARAAAQQQKRAEQQAQRQAVLDERLAEGWAKSGLTKPADYQPPKAGAPLLDIDLDAIKEGEADLADIIAQARAHADRAKAEGEALKAKLEAAKSTLPETPAEDPDVAHIKLYRRIATPAWDLVGGDDPRRAPLEKLLQQAAQSPSAPPTDPARLQQALQALPRQAAMQRQARRAAIEPSQPALSGDQANRIGMHIRQWHMGGIPLLGRDLSGASLAYIDFSGADLRETCFEQADLTGARFIGANLTGAVFLGCRLEGADFSSATLDQANFCQARAHGARFHGASLVKAMALKGDFTAADFTGANLSAALFKEAILTGARLNGAKLVKTLLNDIRADDSHWQGAVLETALLYKASLARADFQRARLNRSVLLDSLLDGGNWGEARLTRCVMAKASARGLQGVGLNSRDSGWRGVDWHQADLTGASLCNCDLGEGQFTEARLDNALLARSLLGGASFRQASARNTSFLQAICRAADFSDADLQQANFLQAALDDARFDRVNLDETQLDAPARQKLDHMRKAA